MDILQNLLNSVTNSLGSVVNTIVNTVFILIMTPVFLVYFLVDGKDVYKRQGFDSTIQSAIRGDLPATLTAF